jgi:hypothetical protein
MRNGGDKSESRDSVRVDNNQPKSGSEDVQNITLSMQYFESGCGGRSRGQRFAAAAIVAMASSASSRNSGGRQQWRKQERQREGRQHSTKKG